MVATTARIASRAGALALLLVLAGCGDAEQDPTTGADPTTEPAVEPTPDTPTPEEPTTGGPLGDLTAEEAAEIAVEDLAERRDVSTDDIAVLRALEVTWPDASLGCPEEGESYAQALTGGTLVELSLDGETYQYHSGRGQAPFLCEEPEPPVEEGTPAD